jgi:TatD DNase family protein
MTVWIDTHCHLDAPEFGTDAADVRARATSVGVAQCVIPAVEVANFDTVRTLAHRFGDAYALGIHPLYVARAQEADLATLDTRWRATGTTRAWWPWARSGWTTSCPNSSSAR